MLLATGEARYADEMERALYNVDRRLDALDGTAFFYSNPLQRRRPAAPTRTATEAADAPGTGAWFDVRLLPAQHHAHARLARALPGHATTTACRSTSTYPATRRPRSAAGDGPLTRDRLPLPGPRHV